MKAGIGYGLCTRKRVTRYPAPDTRPISRNSCLTAQTPARYPVVKLLNAGGRFPARHQRCYIPFGFVRAGGVRRREKFQLSSFGKTARAIDLSAFSQRLKPAIISKIRSVDPRTTFQDDASRK